MASYPFSLDELIPQEERLEILPQQCELYIGVPKGTSSHEKRVCLTPDGVHSLAAHGHRILVESGAGDGANYSDKEYQAAGAEITQDTERVFKCPIVLKVEPLSQEELQWVQPDAVIISALQLKTQNKAYFEALTKKKATALAFEFIKDDDGHFPAVRALSEIAGTGAIAIAAELMSNSNQGKGLLFGNITGVLPTEVVILGAGTVGQFATRTALAFGANVKVFDNSMSRLRRFQQLFDHRVATSTVQPKTLLKALRRCDVVIGAMRGKDRCPIVVSEEMVSLMKRGAVIVDVSIDTGGCFETSEVTTHQHPTFVKHEVIHYCVPNIPSRYAKTASLSISNILVPNLLQLAENGGFENAIRRDKGLKAGVYAYHGIITSPAIADWFQLPYRDINLIVF